MDTRNLKVGDKVMDSHHSGTRGLIIAKTRTGKFVVEHDNDGFIVDGSENRFFLSPESIESVSVSELCQKGTENFIGKTITIVE